jgi:site-specific recombinase XerD
MARIMRKPYYYRSRGIWVVDTVNGRVNLGSDETKAHEAWAAMLAADQRRDDRDPTFAELAMLFVGDSEGRVSRGELSIDTHSNYVWYIDSFSQCYPSLAVSQIEPHHITDWLAANPTWGSSARRHAIGTVKRVLNWGRRERRILSNPIEDVERPSQPRRSAMVGDDDHRKLVMASGGQPYSGRIDRQFRLVLIAIRHCGGRPQDVARARVEFVDAEVTKWTLPEHKTRRHTERPRVVYLSPCLQTITRILITGRESGPLFRGRRGAVTTNAISCRIKRLKKDLDIDPKIVFYSYRHTYLTNGMERGVNVATLAELTGTSISMIQKHYGHLGTKHEHLKAAAAKAMER